MVKKISFKALCLLLVMCLFPLSAMASVDALTSAELTAWRDGLKQVLPALSHQPAEGLYDEQSESWSFSYPFGSVSSDSASPLEGTLTQIEIINDTLSCCLQLFTNLH